MNGYEWILMKFLEGWKVAQGTIDYISVAIPIPFPYFAPIFTPVMYFQWDSNSLLLFGRWQH